LAPVKMTWGPLRPLISPGITDTKGARVCTGLFWSAVP